MVFNLDGTPRSQKVDKIWQNFFEAPFLLEYYLQAIFLFVFFAVFHFFPVIFFTGARKKQY